MQVQGRNSIPSKHYRKGSDIRKEGYLTTIHKLQSTHPKAKHRLDQLLSKRLPVSAVLVQVSQEFPNVILPSLSAVHNYKRKYMDSETARVLPSYEILEIERQKKLIKITAFKELYIIVTELLPKLRMRVERDFDIEDRMNISIQQTNLDMITLASSLREIRSWLETAQISLSDTDSKTTQNPITQPSLDKKEVEEIHLKLQRILEIRLKTGFGVKSPVTDAG